MKSKISIFLLFICLNIFGQSVPNTNTFLFSDICNAVYGSYSAGMTLTGAFTDSDAAKFDSDYGSKAMSPQLFLGFRNYGGTPFNWGWLYNWYVGVNAANIANTGWHMPTDANWTTLYLYLGGNPVAGGKLKETGTVHWLTPNTGATNSSGFTGIAGGYRYVDGTYYDMTKWGRWWSVNGYGGSTGWGVGMDYNSDDLEIQNWLKNHAFSIRLMKDATTLTNGQTATYTGNDGRVYATICIGTQEWMSENLKETEYRDGSSIAFVSGDEWATLTTAARCIYQ